MTSTEMSGLLPVVESKFCEIDGSNVEQEMVTSGGPNRRSYSRSEMEFLRYLNVEQQQRIWDEVYTGLGDAECIVDDKLLPPPPSNNTVARSANKKKKKMKKKKKIVGEDCSQKSEEDFANDGPAHCKFLVENIASEDDFDNIQKPAFLVRGDPDFDSGPPEDGLEYLRRVRWEAAQIPKVKVAKLDKINLKSEQTVYMPMIPDIAKCPEHLLPSKHWEDAFLADFSELRKALMQLDSSCMQSSNYLKSHININEDDSGGSCGDPMLSTILGMDAVSRASMLRNHIRSLDDMETLPRNECAWLYALCAIVDTPLDADTGASLRCLLRKCANLRSEKSDCDDEVAMLNILVTVSGRYFGQAEDRDTFYSNCG